MSLHVISCHMHNKCYMDNTIHTTYRVSWTTTSPAYDFHTSFHSCQYIIQAYINIHMQHVILFSSNDTHTIKPIQHMSIYLSTHINIQTGHYCNTFFYFFFKVSRPESPARPKWRILNRSPVYSDRFHLSYQKHFILEFSITWNHFIYNRIKAFLNIAETVANDKPINIYIYTNTFTLKAFYAPSKRSTKQYF